MTPRPDGYSFLLPLVAPEADLAARLRPWLVELKRLPGPAELIVVPATAEAVPEAIPGIIVADVPDKPGYGSALREGLARAAYDRIGIVSIEKGYLASDLPEMVRQLEADLPETAQKLDVVNGFRCGVALSSAQKWWDRTKRLGLRIAFSIEGEAPPGYPGRLEARRHRTLRAVFALRVFDAHSRMKLIRRTLLDKFPIQSDGEFALPEILCKLNFLGALMAEVPVGKATGVIPHPSGDGSAWGRELRTVFFSPSFHPPVPRTDAEPSKAIPRTTPEVGRSDPTNPDPDRTPISTPPPAFPPGSSAPVP